ncbi:MAG: pyruvate/2-oxoglutarate dehydrogenase complex, dehydrogenase component beta subunit [Dehalococcoidales bacterium]|nr:pyruvate/2-oxoglutarate dehydrogenase complex, dehydrogenase component beta subunit [Dehalococcoidales bacterium]
MDWSKTLLKEELNFDDAAEQQGRKLSYVAALKEALELALGSDDRVFVMGQGVDDPVGMFGITKDLDKKYGADRVFDTPLSEEALTGVAVGAAMSGMRPVYMHNRPDFLLLAMNQIVNHAAKWSYMFGGCVPVPLVIWACVGRGWGGGAQHTQTLQGLFNHVPGLRLVMPTRPYDAKGLLITSIADNNPVIILEHRFLFRQSGYVPEGLYSIPFGRGIIRKSGRDITILAISYMVVEALAAAQELQKQGIDVEVIDPRTLRPLDEEIILSSVKKTGRLLIADTGWKTGGAGAEIAAMVAEKGFDNLKTSIRRIACPDTPTPAGYTLEASFYPGKADIIAACQEMLGRKSKLS